MPLTGRIDEHEPGIGRLDVPATLMHLVVMKPTHQNQVPKLGRPAFGPMHHVMGVQSVLRLTPRELTHPMITTLK